MKRSYNEIDHMGIYIPVDPKLAGKKLAVSTCYPSPTESCPGKNDHCLFQDIARPRTPADKILNAIEQGPPSLPAKTLAATNLDSLSYPSPISWPSPMSSVDTISTTPTTPESTKAHNDDDDDDDEITGCFNPFTALYFTPLAPFNLAPYPFSFVEPQNLQQLDSTPAPPPPIYINKRKHRDSGDKKLLPSPIFSNLRTKKDNVICTNPSCPCEAKPSYFMESFPQL
ncbi:hypothetical protein G210_0906 [Candida maltosa Xu316]|uniref:Uncharacterized protein n=1 Tax=Candida maltosa (strain Xu316) TaxID=1245528 RepID=M3HM51_CANMX|nr:hypothetical protein G210_0906 [Candida maltosa Xu316]